jgi:hypothetical protein
MSKLGDELTRSMAQALAHAQGKRTGSRTHRVTVKPDDDRVPRSGVRVLSLGSVELGSVDDCGQPSSLIVDE